MKKDISSKKFELNLLYIFRILFILHEGHDFMAVFILRTVIDYINIFRSTECYNAILVLMLKKTSKYLFARIFDLEHMENKTKKIISKITQNKIE